MIRHKRFLGCLGLAVVLGAFGFGCQSASAPEPPAEQTTTSLAPYLPTTTRYLPTTTRATTTTTRPVVSCSQLKREFQKQTQKRTGDLFNLDHPELRPRERLCAIQERGVLRGYLCGDDAMIQSVPPDDPAICLYALRGSR